MLKNRMFATVVLGIALAVAGCEKETTDTTTGASGASPSATPYTPAPGATETAATDSQNTVTDATSGASAAAAEAATAAQASGDTPSTPAIPAAGTDAAAAGAATQPTTPAEAQKLIDQTLQYVKENKMDLAEKSLTQLEKMKTSIPVEYHPKIDQARTAFNAAKAGQGLKLDGLVPSSAK